MAINLINFICYYYYPLHVYHFFLLGKFSYFLKRKIKILQKVILLTKVQHACQNANSFIVLRLAVNLIKQLYGGEASLVRSSTQFFFFF